MAKKIITVNVDEEVYSKYSKYSKRCKDRGIIISRQVELFMKKRLEEDDD